MALTRTESQPNIARLTITSRATYVSHYVAVEGSSVMIGSGINCAIRLDDSSISSIHCILRADEGQLYLQDWCSALGTFLGQTRIEEETVVPDGSVIRVGRFEIRVESISVNRPARSLDATPKLVERDPEPKPEPVEVHQERKDDQLTVDADANFDVSEEVDDNADDGTDEGDYASQLDFDDAEAGDRYARKDHVPGRVASGSSGFTAGEERRRNEALLLAGIDPETVQLLQAEIECLQRELSERDRQVAELQSAAETRREAEPEMDSSATESLVGRLEELLQELEVNDQRTRVLEELLRTEQEVTRAQQEEQTQVEAWLKDIERRMLVREQEWQAEREGLVSRAQQYKDERDETDRRLEAAEQSPLGAAVQQNVVRELREQIDTLQDQLEAANRARQSLQAELEKARSTSPEEARREFIEDALREDRLKLAQEQAALSRERAQLAKRLAELDQETQRERRVETDERFRAFRQTLKELHHQDQVGSPGIRKAGLGTRIADLWRKLDGPTDTD